MVIDRSALVAIALGEPESDRLVTAIALAEVRVVAAPTFVEASAVLLRRLGPHGLTLLDETIEAGDISVLEMTIDAALEARTAYLSYGKGVGSPGVLNFGDCLAYGVAVTRGEPLLFTGDDFSRTDVAVAPY